jgi:uncharacterized protein YndB with AHSA1/START domain
VIATDVDGAAVSTLTPRVPDIVHEFPIVAPIEKVFEAISTPTGLDAWWTKRCSGEALEGATWELGFGPGYDWRAVVTVSRPREEIEWRMTDADDDWVGTRVGIRLAPGDGVTKVQFRHVGWPNDNEHYRVSCYCWAMYLRLLKRFVEHGETVPYDERLDA